MDATPACTPCRILSTTGQNVYSQLVYAAKSGDVRHVLVNGRVVMRDRQLLTVDEDEHPGAGRRSWPRTSISFSSSAKRACWKSWWPSAAWSSEETYEVQVKARCRTRKRWRRGCKHPDIALVKETVREQYDTYFIFADPTWGMLRYREDAWCIERRPARRTRHIYTARPLDRARAKEAEYGDAIVLSRSRFTAPADRSLRFYREYFQPDRRSAQIIKKRYRYRIRYRGVDFAVNLDQITQPAREGWYAEIKSRTWSSRDAVRKAALIGELLEILDVQAGDT